MYEKTCEFEIVHQTHRPDKKTFLTVCVLPQSSAAHHPHHPPPPLLLVGLLQQTDNRAPAGLPVHLTGHDSSHAGLCHTLCPMPYLC